MYLRSLLFCLTLLLHNPSWGLHHWQGAVDSSGGIRFAISLRPDREVSPESTLHQYDPRNVRRALGKRAEARSDVPDVARSRRFGFTQSGDTHFVNFATILTIGIVLLCFCCTCVIFYSINCFGENHPFGRQLSWLDRSRSKAKKATVDDGLKGSTSDPFLIQDAQRERLDTAPYCA
mmetsp:Transcript_74201/g.117446  ORF Transcript_74201/g.117446 Transcript_74201/m.117446 type:complete len:177 (+) Transcript_74201:97-627(+)